MRVAIAVIGAALILGLALLARIVLQAEGAATLTTAIFGLQPSYTTSPAPRDLVTGLDQAHAVHWRIPADYVNAAPDYPQTALYASRPTGAKDFIVLSFDLDSLMPWFLVAPQATTSGRSLHRIQVNIHPSTSGFLERARDSVKVDDIHWVPSGETISGLREEQPGPYSIDPVAWRYLPESNDDSRILEIRCIRYPTDQHLRGCSAKAVFSDDVYLEYLFSSADLPRWREIDSKTRQFLTSLIVTP
jgi:hypothetical protein